MFKLAGEVAVRIQSLLFSPGMHAAVGGNMSVLRGIFASDGGNMHFPTGIYAASFGKHVCSDGSRQPIVFIRYKN